MHPYRLILDIDFGDLFGIPDMSDILIGIFVVFGCIAGLIFGLWLLTKSVILGLIVIFISVGVAVIYLGII